MSDAQFALLISTLGALGTALAAVLRWSVGRITKAIDDNTESNKELSRAQIAYAGSISAMATKLDHVSNWVHDHTPLGMDRVDPDEIDRRMDDSQRQRDVRQRLRTNPLGHRSKTHNGSDD